MNMQKKMISIIMDQIEKRGFQATTNYRFSNMGTIGVSTAESVKNFIEVSFHFNDEYFILSLSKDGKKIPSQRGRDDYFDYMIHYNKGDMFDRFRQRFDVELVALAKELKIQPTNKSSVTSPDSKPDITLVLLATHVPEARQDIKDIIASLDSGLDEYLDKDVSYGSLRNPEVRKNLSNIIATIENEQRYKP